MNGVEHSTNSSINDTINLSKQSVSSSTNSEYDNLCEIGSIPFPNSAEWIINAIASFQQIYGELHPYFAIALCFSGTFMNIITVIVLTRPTMISPVNVLLCAVAICDIVVMSSYFVFVIHFLFVAASRCFAKDYSYAWAMFTMFHANASVIFHATSIWLTVSLAQIRVLTIRRATLGPTSNISERFTAFLAIITCIIMSLVNLSSFFTFKIVEVPSTFFLPCLKPPILSVSNDSFLLLNETYSFPNLFLDNKQYKNDNSTIIDYLFQQNFTETSNKSSLTKMFLKNANIDNQNLNNKTFNRLKRALNLNEVISTTLLPIIKDLNFEEVNESINKMLGNNNLIDESTVFVVRAHENDCMKLRMAFWSNGMVFKVVPCLLLTVSIVALLNIISDVGHKRKNLAQIMRKKVPKDHTTPMLAAILSIFLIAELPQGIMLVLNGIFSSEIFLKKIYLPLGDFMDLLSLLNSAIGFLIYVGMSRKFRSVFFQLLFTFLQCIFGAKNNNSNCDYVPIEWNIVKSSDNRTNTFVNKSKQQYLFNSRTFFGNKRNKYKYSRASYFFSRQHQQQFITTTSNITDNTKTEQISQYCPITASSLNASAVATVAATTSLANHLIIYDLFYQKNNAEKMYSDHNTEKNMHLKTLSGLSSRRTSQILHIPSISIIADNLSTTLNQSSSFIKTNNDKITEKRISFNLSTCSDLEAISTTSKQNLIKRHSLFTLLKNYQQSMPLLKKKKKKNINLKKNHSNLCPSSRKRIPSKNKSKQLLNYTNKNFKSTNSQNWRTKVKKWFLLNYDKNNDFSITNHQRQINILQTESSFCGIIY